MKKNDTKKSEKHYQNALIDRIAAGNKDRVFVQHLELKYEIGKYVKGREFGMPDTITDLIEFDKKENFHLWELKLLDSNEIWTGKFFGQMMVYDFLFSTEPWNELLGRFAVVAQKGNHRGDIDKILSHLAGYGEEESEEESDEERQEENKFGRRAKFKSWNLCVCGGHGYELAVPYNPMIWSLWNMSESYLHEETPKLKIWHFYETPDGYELKPIQRLRLQFDGGISRHALDKYLAFSEAD
jgi:hypothetical protein